MLEILYSPPEKVCVLQNALRVGGRSRTCLYDFLRFSHIVLQTLFKPLIIKGFIMLEFVFAFLTLGVSP